MLIHCPVMPGLVLCDSLRVSGHVASGWLLSLQWTVLKSGEEELIVTFTLGPAGSVRSHSPYQDWWQGHPRLKAGWENSIKWDPLPL